MSKPYDFHPHELGGYVREFTFSDGTTWRSCTAMSNGKQCKYAVGEGRSPKTVCKRHTFSDVDVLPELDGVIAPEIEDDLEEPETGEITVDGWIAAGEAITVPDEPGDAKTEDNEVEESETDEESDEE